MPGLQIETTIDGTWDRVRTAADAGRRQLTASQAQIVAADARNSIELKGEITAFTGRTGGIETGASYDPIGFKLAQGLAYLPGFRAQITYRSAAPGYPPHTK